MNERKPLTRIWIYLFLFFLIWSLRASVFYFVDTNIEFSILRNIYSNAIKFIVWVLPVIVYIKYVNKENPLVKLKLVTAITKQNLFQATLAIILYFGGLIAFELVASGKTLLPLFQSNAVEIVQTLASVFVSPFLEEILFRGFVLNEFSERLSFGRANLLTSLFFVLAHYPNWLWVNGFQTWILFNSLSIFVLSLFLGLLFKKTDSLYPSIVAHIINNFLVGFLQN